MKRVALFLSPLAMLAIVYFLRGPYLFPTSAALGPCLMDWTSPATWTPRSSPMRTLDLEIDGQTARLCYGSPSARGRTLFGAGGLVRNGRLWRMGANEPTRLFAAQTLSLGGLTLEPGRYSIYAQPDSTQWTVFVTQSTWHWGNMITQGVRSQEIGSFQTVPTEADVFEEQLVFASDGDVLTMAWGTLRLHLPISR